DLLIGERSDLAFLRDYDAYQIVAFKHRDAEQRPERLNLSYAPCILGIGLNVGDVHRSSFQGRSSGSTMPSRSDWVPFDELSELRRCVVRGRRPKHLAVEQEDERPLRVASPHSLLQYSLEDGWQLEPRTTDHPEHIGRCGLLLQGFAQFVQQPRVFDGYHRLTSEIGK